MRLSYVLYKRESDSSKCQSPQSWKARLLGLLADLQSRIRLLAVLVRPMKGRVVFIDEATLSEALSFVSGCSQCALTPELTLDYILDALTRNGMATVYMLPNVAACPQCGHEIDRATFINVA